MSKQFYTYLYHDPKDGTPIYVGKGFGKRYTDHIKLDTHLGYLIRKRKAEGYQVEPIVHIELDEETALEMEKFWIAMFGRADLGTGTLFNLTDGGEGTSGYKRIHSEETKAKISAANKGKPSPNKGKELPEETKEKLRLANIGRKHSDETRAYISEVQKGRKVSDETRAKISAARKGMKFTEEHIANLKASHLGNKLTPESILKREATKKSKRKNPIQ